MKQNPFVVTTASGVVVVNCRYPGCTTASVVRCETEDEADEAMTDHRHTFDPPRWMTTST